MPTQTTASESASVLEIVRYIHQDVKEMKADIKTSAAARSEWEREHEKHDNERFSIHMQSMGMIKEDVMKTDSRIDKFMAFEKGKRSLWASLASNWKLVAGSTGVGGGIIYVWQHLPQWLV